VIDTGADGTFVLFQHFVRLHLAQQHDTSKLGTGERSIGSTVQGDTEMRSITASLIVIGDLFISEVIGLMAPDRNAFADNDSDGLIGSHILANFVVYLDYARNHIILEDPPGAKR
jgi:hypothetical protein